MGSPENIHNVNTMVAAPLKQMTYHPFSWCNHTREAEKLGHEWKTGVKVTSEIATRGS